MKVLEKRLLSMFLVFTFIVTSISTVANASFSGRSNIGNLVVFLKFSDQEDPTQEDMKTIRDLYCNDKGEPCLKQYVYDYTYGKTSLNNIFLTDENDNMLFCTDTCNRSHYLKKSEDNPDGYDGPEDRKRRNDDIISKAIDFVNSHLDSSITSELLDGNGDGTIDNITVLVQGGPAEDENYGLLHPHKSFLCCENKYILDKKAEKFNLGFISEAKEGYSTSAHELFHTVGYPDLYRYCGVYPPIGDYDLMASTNNEPDSDEVIRPQQTLMFTKYKYGGIGHAPIEITESGEYELFCTNDDDGTKPCFARIVSPFSDTESVYVEYRRLKDEPIKQRYEDKDEGLLLYRVDEGMKSWENGNALAAEEGNGVRDYIFMYNFWSYPNDSFSIPNGAYNMGNAESAFLLKPDAYVDAYDTEGIRKSVGSTEPKEKAERGDLYFYDGSNSGIKVTALEYVTDEATGLQKMKFRVDIYEAIGAKEPVITRQPYEVPEKDNSIIPTTIGIETDHNNSYTYQWQYQMYGQWMDIGARSTDSRYLIKSMGLGSDKNVTYRCKVYNKGFGYVISEPMTFSDPSWVLSSHKNEIKADVGDTVDLSVLLNRSLLEGKNVSTRFMWYSGIDAYECDSDTMQFEIKSETDLNKEISCTIHYAGQDGSYIGSEYVSFFIQPK